MSDTEQIQAAYNALVDFATKSGYSPVHTLQAMLALSAKLSTDLGITNAERTFKRYCKEAKESK